MKKFEGILKMLGPSTTTQQPISVTTYSFIEIGDQVLKKVKVFDALNGRLHDGVASDGPVVLYVRHNLVCAVSLQNGKTYASQMVGQTYLWVVIASAAILGLITLPFLGMGLFFLYIGWRFWTILDAKKAASAIPGAILI